MPTVATLSGNLARKHLNIILRKHLSFDRNRPSYKHLHPEMTFLTFKERHFLRFFVKSRQNQGVD